MITLVLALIGVCLFAALAAGETIDQRLRRRMTPDEWQEDLEYRAFLRTTWFGCDKQAWRAMGRPERRLR